MPVVGQGQGQVRVGVGDPDSPVLQCAVRVGYESRAELQTQKANELVKEHIEADLLEYFKTLFDIGKDLADAFNTLVGFADCKVVMKALPKSVAQVPLPSSPTKPLHPRRSVNAPRGGRLALPLATLASNPLSL